MPEIKELLDAEAGAAHRVWSDLAVSAIAHRWDGTGHVWGWVCRRKRSSPEAVSCEVLDRETIAYRLRYAMRELAEPCGDVPVQGDPRINALARVAAFVCSTPPPKAHLWAVVLCRYRASVFAVRVSEMERARSLPPPVEVHLPPPVALEQRLHHGPQAPRGPKVSSLDGRA